jgi:two-component system, OmpR family, sensor histidine kinase BaeS
VDAQAVAYVDLAPLRLPAEQGERAFLREQWRDALLVGAAALLLSAAVSMGFARHLKRPVRQLVEGTRALTQGQLDTRLPAQRRDEFGLLALHFNQMAQQLQQQERGRREWLASTAHELRTPLAVLRALIEAQQEGIRQGDPATLQCLHDQVMSLSRLVDDLHELARHDAGSVRLQRQPLHPKGLIEGVLASQRERLAQAGLSPSLHDHSGDLLIDADPQRLSQLFHNLVENSCRYTDAPGRLDIHLGLMEGPGPLRQWRADFDDSAPGLAEADRARLFERFFRAEASRSRATGGSGLGLSICRAIAEEHGGQIEAMASPLGGLRVRLVLPVSAAPVPPRVS